MEPMPTSSSASCKLGKWRMLRNPKTTSQIVVNTLFKGLLVHLFSRRARVTTLLACRANPSGFQFIETFWGDGDVDAWTAETPLHAAVRTGRLSSVQLLLRHGASVEEHGYLEKKRGEAVHPDGGNYSQWQSGLFLAVSNGAMIIVKTFLDNHANPTALCYSHECSSYTHSSDEDDEKSAEPKVVERTPLQVAVNAPIAQRYAIVQMLSDVR